MLTIPGSKSQWVVTVTGPLPIPNTLLKNYVAIHYKYQNRKTVNWRPITGGELLRGELCWGEFSGGELQWGRIVRIPNPTSNIEKPVLEL
uniref:Uncharacterized protein n=1 Tax=Romanomermis culicivorax TaxID=13658 RepID=A0A915K6I3_ROMCU